ncbi:MAG: EamA family transporter RarD [Novosphingobium sp.]|uniref:EamA family transporter RarD n=1 Tax=Novosphingobium sp. TaxID=1874826 RepID=UPI0032BB4D6D
MPATYASHRHAGLIMAITAYTIWGVMPLYLLLVRWVPAYEFIAWRVICTIPVCLFFLLTLRQFAALGSAVRNRRVLALLALSALLVAINWTIYVAAVQSGQVLAASLGYYINPLANVFAGTLFLGERLTRGQWIAVALAALGVSLLAWDAREMLWISLSLAVTFCAYGLVRKLAPVESLPGLTIETLILLVPALLTVWWYAQGPQGIAMGRDAGSSALLAFSGAMTGIPLLLFAAAARRMDYSTLGMTQFFAPTIVFVLGVTVFGEPLRPSQLACFVMIWCAIAVFVWDILMRSRSAQQAPA